MTVISENLHRQIDEAAKHWADQVIRVSGNHELVKSVDEYIQAVTESDEQLNSYRRIPNRLASVYGRLDQNDHTDAVSLFNKFLMLRMMSNANTKPIDFEITDDIRELIATYFARILAEIQSDRVRNFRYENDLRAKDMGVCRLRLIPCGAELIDRFSGVPRSVLISRNVVQTYSALRFFVFKSRHFRIFFESHWDRRLIRDFSPEGFDRCYMKVASLLEVNPDIHGVIGSTWWFDPVVEQIAPELFYLQKLFLDNGAISINLGSDADAVMDATTFSPNRTKLVESGEYVPRRFMLIWHRTDILLWRNRKLVAAS